MTLLGVSMAQRNLEEKIEDAKTEGWKVKNREENRAVVIKRNGGSSTAHIILFIFTFWTLGWANLLFWGFKKISDVDKKVLRPDTPSE